MGQWMFGQEWLLLFLVHWLFRFFDPIGRPRFLGAAFFIASASLANVALFFAPLERPRFLGMRGSGALASRSIVFRFFEPKGRPRFFVGAASVVPESAFPCFALFDFLAS